MYLLFDLQKMAEGQDSEEDFIRRWGKENALSQDTIEKLILEDVTSEEIILALTTRHIENLDLGADQTSCLRKAQSTLLAAKRLVAKQESLMELGKGQG